MPPFAESVVYIELNDVVWHFSPYGIVIYATARVRVYFTFGDLFETFVMSPGFDPMAMGVPLHHFHQNIVFPPPPEIHEQPPEPEEAQESVSETDPLTPSHYYDPSYVQSSHGSNSYSGGHQ